MPRLAERSRTLTAAERLAAQIKNRIAAGVYVPNSYLPAERDLARALDTSRRSLRGAVALLSQESLVQPMPGRGTRVLPPQERLPQSMIGVLHGHWRGSPPEHLGIMRGVQTGLARLGYRYEAAPVGYTSHALEIPGATSPIPVSLNTLCERYGAFLWIETFGYEETILELERRRIPVVVANLEVVLDVTASWVDHRKVTAKAVELLVRFGHRRIAFISRPRNVYFYGQSHEGYRAGLESAGIHFDESLVALSRKPNPLDAYVAARKLLTVRPRPTAIVAARDILAQGAWQACVEAGMAVGRDVSIIGFDDHSWFEDYSWPQEEPLLTTFHEPCQEMGEVAVEMLADRIVNGHRPPERREIDAPLILRRSVGPLVADCKAKTGRSA
jgi:DNA-binding LacI/PurR family transcriptional regulator